MSSDFVVRVAANGHTMLYRVVSRLRVSQWDAVCVEGCRACAGGEL